MKKYKIDKMKNIGNVIFVVEGGRPETGGTELRLLKKIFADILGYEVQELRRGSEESAISCICVESSKKSVDAVNRRCDG